MSYEDEEDNLIDELNNGSITQKEFDRGMSELRRDFRDQAEEAANEARDSFYNSGW